MAARRARGGELNARAAVVAAPRRAELTTVPVGDPGPGQVLVEVEGGGVCGSNLPVWEGRPWFAYPLAPGAPGHEAWGVVSVVGDDVAGLAAGDRFALLADNAFADTLLVDAERCVRVPPEVTGPFPGEALGCGFNVAARSGFAAGQTVAVVGIGFIGALVVALAARAGAEVVAVSRRPFSLDVAKTMGAHELVSLDDAARWAERCDVVVEAVGAQSTLDLAGGLVKVRGRLVIAGFHQDGPRTVDVQSWNWRGIDVVNAHERELAVQVAGVRAAAEAVATGRLDPTPLYTHTYPLARLGEAMDAMASRPNGFLKALVTR
ncbi:MAG TPA: zinc-binding dehydrogenase [Mycobacteriales bacterium]|nr:zinc-binding dehydrogenase [Mycobacteriales bacterium]